MKNLVLLTERRRALPVAAADHGSPSVACMARDPGAPRDGEGGMPHLPDGEGSAAEAEPSAFYLTKGGILVATSAAGTSWECDLNSVVSPPPASASASGDGLPEGPDWFDVAHVDDLDGLVCISRRGAIVTVEKGDGRPELVGEFENGIEAALWSPDREVLALYTHTAADGDDPGAGQVPALMTMNAQFEVLAEVVTEDDVPRGGGSGGGSGGGGAGADADPDASVAMCWRPDGTAVAVSSVDSADGVRRIRTYGREELALQAVGRSEDGSGRTVPNLLPTSGISWAGLGCSQLLVAVQRKGRRADSPRLVVFFEPNGLRHGEFRLRPDSGWGETVTGLSWNCESDLLAVTLRCSSTLAPGDDGPPETRSKVQLWHRSNYHWYLKQELRYESTVASMVTFDEERPRDVTVALKFQDSAKLELREYTFVWDASVVSHGGTAAAVDGDSLNFTPFHQAMVPPPMYFATVPMAAPIAGIVSVPPFLTARSTGMALSWVATLSDGTLALLGQDGDKPRRGSSFVAPTLLASVSLDCARTLRQFLVANISSVGGGTTAVRMIGISCGNGPSDASEDIVEIEILLDGSEPIVNVVGRISVEGRILRIGNWVDADGALIETTDGCLLEYESAMEGLQGSVVPSSAEPFLEPCPWVQGLFGSGHERRIIIGRSSRSRLYLGERILSDASSSFAISQAHQFLGYATLGSRSQLRFIPLSALAKYDPLMGSEENVDILGEGYEPRSCERGSRLLAILPETPTAVLQLPRGNLEGVYPRALVLPFVMGLIKKGEFGRALEIMRRQKIDLNLVCDMNPVKFLQDGGVLNFISQVRKIDYLNLFISSLFDGDITQWKYRVPNWVGRGNHNREEQPKFDFTTKVNQVCSKMREIMISFESNGETVLGDKVDDDYYLLPILSTFAKQNPPKLEDALSLIRENAIAKTSANSKKSPLLGDRAQRSFQYLAFLADYSLLFNTALGMYDFDLARAVARNSQMDPKVYLALVKRLKSLPESVARYEVDVRLERFDAALENLVKHGGEPAGSDPSSDEHFKRCLEFIEQHKLHQLGLELFHDKAKCKRTIMISLGERLLGEGRGEAAMSIFCSAKPRDANGAMRAARLSGDWRSFFTFLDACELEEGESQEERRMRFAEAMAEEIAMGKGGAIGREGYACAARILIDYGKDIHGAIDMLLKGEMWSEARRLALLHDRGDLIKRCTDSAASYAEDCLEDFENRSSTFVKTNKRYKEVLIIRKDARRNGEVAMDGDIGDSGSVFSMASNLSNTSLGSNMSGSSTTSVASVSTVISAGGVSSFSLTGEEAVNKHRSIYNIGKKKKKTKKSKHERRSRRAQPGSERELTALVETLKVNFVNKRYTEVVVETITFLLQVGKGDLAQALYDAYNQVRESINNSQNERKEETKKEDDEAVFASRREGGGYEKLTLDCESEIDALQCTELPVSIPQVFAFLQV